MRRLARATAVALAAALAVAASGAAAKAPPPLTTEAASAAAGDIPDNQVFLAYVDRAAGYSVKYAEGWARSGGGQRVVFRDKDNLVRVDVRHGAAPTPASVRAELAPYHTVRVVAAPHRVELRGGRALVVTYRTPSAPNPVTGKRATLQVDRYELARGGRVAVLELGTRVGVDNLDAYRLIANSFRWR